MHPGPSVLEVLDIPKSTMVLPGVFFAAAVATMLHLNIALMHVLTARILASAIVIVRLAEAETTLDHAHCADTTVVLSVLSNRRRGRTSTLLGGLPYRWVDTLVTTLVTALVSTRASSIGISARILQWNIFRKRIHTARSPVLVGLLQGSVQSLSSRVTTANASSHTRTGGLVSLLEPTH